MSRVHFVTLSRSDYATLRPVALAALRDKTFDVKVIAGGSHMLARFGRTIDSIRKDGLPISNTVDFLSENDNSDSDMAMAYSRAVDGFVRTFSADPPDYVFIVGDRWEMMAVATAASMLRIPIAHHSGGDITQGSSDNQVRYVLTTLSHLHFVALEEHRKRLISMGEEPDRVIVTGEPALTELNNYAANVPDVRKVLGLEAGAPFALATFHPTTYDALPVSEQIDFFIKALDLVEGDIVLTAPNPDPGNAAFYDALSRYANNNAGRVHLHESLGTDVYYAAMEAARFMIGNSSSGLWEAPSFGLPVINIGNRQGGRVRCGNVIDTGYDLKQIKSVIAKTSDPGFRESLAKKYNPYVYPDTIKRILSVLKEGRLKSDLLAKVFVDPLGK